MAVACMVLYRAFRRNGWPSAAPFSATPADGRLGLLLAGLVEAVLGAQLLGPALVGLGVVLASSSRSTACSARMSTRVTSSSWATWRPPSTTAVRLPASMYTGPTARAASRGAWPGRTPRSPSTPRAVTKSASPAHLRSGVTRWTSRPAGRPAELLGLLLGLLDPADVEEGLLGQVVVVALGQGVEGGDGLVQRHRLARRR